jgi:type VI secretion system protein ImpI/type VI secretion system protein
MPLLLRVYAPPDADEERLIEVDASLRVGRGPDNDLVLPDPDRLLSKSHCQILREGAGYVLFDTSANGTFMNDRRERLTHGAAMPLAVDDAIYIGSYTLSVVSVVVPHDDQATAVPRRALLGPISDAPPRVGPEPPREEIDDLLAGMQPEPGASVEDFLTDVRPDEWDGPQARSDHTSADSDSLSTTAPQKEAIPDDWDPLASIATQHSAKTSAPSAPQPDTNPFDEPPAPSTAPAPIAHGGQQEPTDVLAACGLDTANLSEARARIAAERAGRILRITIDGLLQILSVRSVAKQEFGIERTVITRGANNPMKFVNTVDEALQMLLCRDTPGFLPAEDAVRQTVNDIQSHQLALLTAVQVAFTDALRQLDPDTIEAAVPHLSADPLIPTLRKARAWDHFRARFTELDRSLGDRRELFGSEFARAYAATQRAAQGRNGGGTEGRHGGV